MESPETDSYIHGNIVFQIREERMNYLVNRAWTTGYSFKKINFLYYTINKNNLQL